LILAPGMRTALRWTAMALLVAAFAGWALLHVDLPALGAILAGADLWRVLLAMPALILGAWVARTLRWLVVLGACGVAAPAGRTYLSVGAALGLAVVTPLQAGEMLKLAHARSAHGVGLATAAGGFAAERMLDILVLGALTLAAALWLAGGDRAAWTLGGLAAAGAAALGAVLLAQRSPGLIAALPAAARRALDGAAALSPPRILLPVLAATVAAWLLTALLWQVAAEAVEVRVPFALNLLLLGLVMVATVASLVPGGAGVSDLAAVAVLVQHGYTAEQAVAAALMLRLITVQAALLGLVHWLVLRASRRGG
jgi:uncharacterized membrane protein YbhN (UPF0104 family)